MSVENLGEPLTGVYSISGGQAQLYERGMTVDGPAGAAVVSFAFPMIGRPSIERARPMPIAPFGPDAITFSFGDEPLAPVVSLIQNALADRLSLMPTGQTTARVPVTIGSERS